MAGPKSYPKYDTGVVVRYSSFQLTQYRGLISVSFFHLIGRDDGRGRPSLGCPTKHRLQVVIACIFTEKPLAILVIFCTACNVGEHLIIISSCRPFVLTSIFTVDYDTYKLRSLLSSAIQLPSPALFLF